MPTPTQAAPSGATIPQGAVIGGASSGPPIPQGATIGMPQQSAPQQSQPTTPDNSHPTGVENPVGGFFQGMGEGVFSTLGGAGRLINKATNAAVHVGDSINKEFGQPTLDEMGGHSQLEQQITGPRKHDLIPQSLIDKADYLAGDTGHGTAQKVGYGGETLTEFLLGDAALKGLSMSERLAQAAKVTKVIEGSPTAMKALQIGASIMKQATLHAGEAALVQGGQTLVRSGGDVHAAAHDAKNAAIFGGATGAATTAVGETLSALGKTAQKTESLSNAAGNAQTKEEVAKDIATKLKNAQTGLHTDYEAGIQDLNQRLGGTEVHAQQNPLAERAKELLAQPEPGEHPIVAQAKEAAGDRLDKKVRGLLESISNGEVPGEKDVTKPSGLVDQYGNAIESEPQPKTAPPYKVDNLVNLRQTIRQLADSYEYGDINSRALRSLINGKPGEISALDQTIEKLAQASGDDTAVSDYRNLRANYAKKINLFDEPVIQKLMDGKVDDAAKDFVGVVRKGDSLPAAGKIRYNTDVLRGVIGDDGVKAFGKQVFGTMLRDSVEDSRFNPAKFIETWKKVNSETKGDLFDMENAQNGLRDLANDAQSAANLQHLTRAGVLGGVGAVAGHSALGGAAGLGLGSLLGLTVAEGGGIAKGRELLNYVANHPAAWGTYKLLGKAADSAAADTAATALRGAASQAAAAPQTEERQVVAPDEKRGVKAVTLPVTKKPSPALKNAYSGLSDSLGQ